MIGNAKAAYVRKLIVDVESATIGLEVDLKSKHRLLRVDVLRELTKRGTQKTKQKVKYSTQHSARPNLDVISWRRFVVRCPAVRLHKCATALLTISH